MLFEVRRASAHTDEIKPCQEAHKVQTFRVDERTVDDPTKIPSYRGMSSDWWYKRGRNHRVEKGHIKRDFDVETWAINLESLEELLAFYRKYGNLIVEPSLLRNGMTTLTIYDGYIE